MTPTSCVSLCRQLNSVLKYWLVQPYVFCILTVLCTLWQNSVAFRWLWGFEHVTREEKRNKKNSLLKNLWVFPFCFPFVMQPNQKKVLAGLRVAVNFEIFPRMISQVLAALLSIHRTCQPGSSTGATSLPGLDNTDLVSLSSCQLEQNLVLHRLCRASVTGFSFRFFVLRALVNIVTVSVHLGSKALTVHY